MQLYKYVCIRIYTHICIPNSHENTISYYFITLAILYDVKLLLLFVIEKFHKEIRYILQQLSGNLLPFTPAKSFKMCSHEFTSLHT